MTQVESLAYGAPTLAQSVAYLLATSQAFGGKPPADPEPEAKKRLTDKRIVTVDGRVAGGLLILDDAQWFGGGRLRSWAIAGVAVTPEHRGSDVGRRLMVEMLREARAAAVPLSVLYAATATFYRKLGYEFAGEFVTWSIDPEKLRARRTDAEFVRFAADDVERATAMYRQVRARENGPFERNDHFFRHFEPHETQEADHWQPAARRHAYWIRIAGVDRGYLVLDNERQDGALFVRDLVLSDRSAAEAAATFLYRHRSVHHGVRWIAGAADPLRYAIAEASAIKMVEPTETWLLRVVHVEEALKQRGYPPIHAELHLEVRDELLEENAGRYVLSLREGRPTVQRGGGGRITLDARGLAALFTGYLHPTELQRAGLLDGPDEDLQRLALAFAGPRPYMLDKF
jgi:predicted acetyltransferase